MFWAVQVMAVELSKRVLVMGKIQESGEKVFMLVTAIKATFTKKATGKISFTCNDGHLIDAAIKNNF